ncbi:hypothetical protein CLOLEP_03689 [[Clostridium] leptum DSM 753]|uniref:Uncharacterized protein n=1 Tax=[Clostridium] leptum DSM 753 TaxID=428125 RepID=A7VYL1_9FIRM|nr:hypothetical protein CLOLEP_03689 [[Clostridium] leptum DSM 753]
MPSSTVRQAVQRRYFPSCCPLIFSPFRQPGITKAYLSYYA